MIEFIKRCFIQRMEGQYQPPPQPPIFKIECIPGMNNLYKACDNTSDYFMYLLDVEFCCVFKPLILIGGTRKIDVFPRERIIRLDEDSKFRSRFLFDIAHEISHLKVFEIIGDMRRICYRLKKEEIIEQILEAIIREQQIMMDIAKNFDKREIEEEISRFEIEENSKNGNLRNFKEATGERVGKRINLLFDGDLNHTYSTIEDKKKYDKELFRKIGETFEENKDKFSRNKKKQFEYELNKKKEECNDEKDLDQEENEKFRHFIGLILNYFRIFKREDFRYVAKVTDFIIYILFGLLPKTEEFKDEFRDNKKYLTDLICEYLAILIGVRGYVICTSARFDDEENEKLYERVLEFIEGGKGPRDMGIGFFRVFYAFFERHYPKVIRNLLNIGTGQEIPKDLCEFLRKRDRILRIADDMESKLAGDNFEDNAYSCLEKLSRCNPDRILYNFWIIHQKRSEQLTQGGLSTPRDVYSEYKSSHLLTMEIVNILSRGGYCD